MDSTFNPEEGQEQQSNLQDLPFIPPPPPPPEEEQPTPGEAMGAGSDPALLFDAEIKPSNRRTFHNAAYEAVDAARREWREYILQHPGGEITIQRYTTAINNLNKAIEELEGVFQWQE